MISPDASLAARAARPEACSACGAALDSIGRCQQCGAVFGEAYRCPLCQALSDVEPNTTLYYRCRACGGPRIPPTDSPISEAEAALLRSARAEQLRAGAFKAGAGFAVASGALSLLLTSVVLLVTSPGAVAKFAALLASVVPFALSLFAWRRAQGHAAALRSALQQAWLLAASRVVAAHAHAQTSTHQMSAAELARSLRIDEPRAELLLAELSVRDFVEQPAELPARLRVTELADPAEPTATAAEEAARVDVRKP
ncbi:MAG: hypothetical protein ABW061_23065 [Polyangiaceae bacterium]